VLSQVVGQSGLRMIRAILRGERDPHKLVELCDVQILKTKRERMLEALNGFWHPEQLFALGQALEGWEFYQKQMAACDQQIAEVMEQIGPASAPQPEPCSPPSQGGASAKRKSTVKAIRHNPPQIAGFHEKVGRLCGGHDLAQLPCMTDYSALQIVAEVGTDMSPWATDKHFVAWLGLAPACRTSGKSRRREKRFRGRAGRLFCLAAQSLARSKYLALGGFYRRIRATRGAKVANIAAGRKLAQLFYWTLKHGLAYVEQGLQAYETKYRAQSIKRLKAAARHFGLSVVSDTSPTPVA
jgi:transposase